MNAADFRALMERWAVVMADHRDWLIQLDSVVGDSDLGADYERWLPRCRRCGQQGTRRRCRKDGVSCRKGDGECGSFHDGNFDGKWSNECRKNVQGRRTV